MRDQPTKEIVRKRYAEKLLDNRWQQRKTSIQIRDQFQCQKCQAKNETVHVHHRYYIPGRDPWDYPDNLLILLCAKCHKEEEQAADVIKEMAPALQYHGYFNTEIRDFVNKLIESKINHAGQNIESQNIDQ
jgi:hypothetical protein